MKNTYKFQLFLVVVLLLSFSNVNAQILKAEIRATGLTCSMCSNAINKQLKTIPEVVKVETDLNTNTFTVTLSKENTLSPNVFKQKVEKAGFFVGSLIITLPANLTNSDAYIFVENEKTNANEIQIQILDKGYVTEKEYKKLLKSLKKIDTYALNNEDDFHVKRIKL